MSYINELCGCIEFHIQFVVELLQEVVKFTILKASPMGARSELLPDPEAPGLEDQV